MTIQTFTPIQYIWFVIYSITLITCIVISIRNVIKNKNKFTLLLILEALTMIINFGFMYLIDNHIEYGNNMFSGLSQVGDWIGHLLMIFIAIIPTIITLICNVIYNYKRKKVKENDNIENETKV